jgi:hypothetical protein
VFLCLTTALIHVLLVFLHVAPPNPLSQQYSRQVNAWVFPLFEQNWRLFAPDPESVNRQISARTMSTTPDGTILSQRLIKPSGNKSWDEAVIKAIIRTETMPKDVDGRVPTPMILEFRPKD